MYRIIIDVNAPWPLNTWFDCDNGYCVQVKPQSDRRGNVVSHVDVGIPFAIPDAQVIPYSVAVGGRGLEIRGQRHA